MNDVKLIIQLISIFIACLIYVGIWYWIWMNREDYLQTLYIGNPWKKFISNCCWFWLFGHVIGAIAVILWAWL